MKVNNDEVGCLLLVYEVRPELDWTGLDYTGTKLTQPKIGITVKLKSDVSKVLYKYFDLGSINCAIRPTFDTPHEHVCNSCNLKNKSGLFVPSSNVLVSAYSYDS